MGGDTTVSRPIGESSATIKSATEFFSKDAGSYGEFKTQCNAVRVFAFAGVCVGCTLGLMLNPPKSSYWARYSPMYYFKCLTGAFSGSSPPLFLKAKAEHEADVPAIAKELITTR